MELSDLSLRLRALSALRGLQKTPLVRAVMHTLDSLTQDSAAFADAYGALCAAHYACGDASRTILDAVHYDVNTLTDTLAAPADALLDAATRDIQTVNALLALDGAALKSAAATRFGTPALLELPDFPAGAPLPFRDGAALASYYRAQGYGFFAQAAAFAVQDDGSVRPIVHPDLIRLCYQIGRAHV